MEFINELLQNIDLFGIIGWVVGLLGISVVSALWNTFKEGRETYKKYFEYKQGGWTEQEKTDYITESGEFWQSVNSLWNAITQIFKKKK